MTIQDLRNRGLILLECISGSRAYGLDTKDSDTDIKGVFYLPEDDFFGFSNVTQINNETNDEVFYEVGRYFELLTKNNPNLIDLLNTPDECVLYRHPIMDRIKPEMFLSKLCSETYGQYAFTQIRKAKSLNKKVLNPVDKERKGVLDFCYVVQGQGAIPVADFLSERGLDQQQCGLSRIAHMNEMYGLYYSEQVAFKGIANKVNANEVSLSSIPKGHIPIAIMSYNKSAYSSYCKEYKAYWNWVEHRNDVRYQNTLTHGKKYDAKNMMHTFRLLNMAEEIGSEGRINVRRPDREFLLKIKTGEFEYEELVTMATEKLTRLKDIYTQSALPEKPDVGQINQLLVELRKHLYIKNR